MARSIIAARRTAQWQDVGVESGLVYQVLKEKIRAEDQLVLVIACYRRNCGTRWIWMDQQHLLLKRANSIIPCIVCIV